MMLSFREVEGSGRLAAPFHLRRLRNRPPVAGPESADKADVIVVPSRFDDGREPSGQLRTVLQQAHQRGVTILGLCLGTIPVADAGLLDGRSAVTHWEAFSSLSARHPDVFLDQTVLYIDHGDVLTSAGTASGLDACLHLVRTRLGSAAANHAHMSRRTFIRAFRASTGATPSAWVRSQRLDAARHLLESSSLPIEQVAVECGFGSAVTLRQNFARAFSTTPTDYRRRFDAQPRLVP